MLLAIDLDEYFINEKGVAIASVFSLQAAGINVAEFDAPEPNRFAGDSNTAFGQKILDIPVAQVETIVEPNGIRNDIRRESVALVGIHEPSLSISPD